MNVSSITSLKKKEFQCNTLIYPSWRVALLQDIRIIEVGNHYPGLFLNAIKCTLQIPYSLRCIQAVHPQTIFLSYFRKTKKNATVIPKINLTKNKPGKNVAIITWALIYSHNRNLDAFI